MDADIPLAAEDRSVRVTEHLKSNILAVASAIRVKHLVPFLLKRCARHIDRLFKEFDRRHPPTKVLQTQQQQLCPGMNTRGENRIFAAEDKDRRAAVFCGKGCLDF